MKIVMINYEDTSVEILDVQDSMVKEDVEEFLCEHEYDLDNIYWMVAQDDKVAVRGHEYRMGKDGKEKHTTHEMHMEGLAPWYMKNSIKSMELRELKEAVSKYGVLDDDGNRTVRFCEDYIHFDGLEGAPIITGYDPSGEPCDYVISCVTVDKDGLLRIFGGVKDTYMGELDIDTDDLISGSIHYITDAIIEKEGAA